MENELKTCSGMYTEGKCESVCNNDLLKAVVGDTCCQVCQYQPVCNNVCDDWDCEEEDDDDYDLDGEEDKD